MKESFLTKETWLQIATRIYSITLTDLGQKVLEQLVNISDNANKASIYDLNIDEFKELVRALNTICNTLEKLL